MKIILLTASLILSTVAHAQTCNHPIDANKVVIYVATNPPGTELAGAVDVACRRGEHLITIPPEEKLTEIGNLKQQWDVAFKAYQTAFTKYSLCVGDHRVDDPAILAKCQKLNDSEASLLKVSNPIREKYEQVTKDAGGTKTLLEAKLTELKSSGAKVTAIVLSGHDGAGSFHGDIGYINKEMIFQIEREFPEQIDTLTSILLMGCASVSVGEVDQWKTEFPNLKIIAGFPGIGPLSVREGSGSFISDMLASEPRVRTSNSQKQLQGIMQGVRNVEEMNAGVYFDLSQSCSSVIGNNNEYFYASPANKHDSSLKIGFSRYEPGTSDASKLVCQISLKTIDWNTLSNYFSGYIEPKNDETLSNVYIELRHLGYCYNEEFSGQYTPDQILMLRFFQDVKKNFSKYYATLIKDANAELDAFVFKKSHEREALPEGNNFAA